MRHCQAATVKYPLYRAVGTTFVLPPKTWRGIQAYAGNFNVLEMASFIPAFLLAPTVVVLMACIHCVTPEKRQVFSLTGLAFASVYAVIIPANYYLQLFVVHLNLKSGSLEGLALLSQPNIHSVFFALETLGYAFLSLATLFASQVFSGGKLESWIRWLFIVSGAVGRPPEKAFDLIRYGFGWEANPRECPVNLDLMIAEAAYYKAEKRNFHPGYELLDWLEAKTEVLTDINNHT
jgi:hypothetical protein